MIQFNLLPDVKIAFIKAQRQKRLVISVSIIASIAAITIFVLLFTFVNLAQKKNMNDLTADIKTENNELMGTEDLDKMLTVQNQLTALDTLHGQKTVATRTFQYIQQATPASVSVNQLDVDYTLNTISITGKAGSLAAVNTYADSLKFTKYRVDGDAGQETSAFSEVVLASFSRSDNSNNYNITLKYDPIIFAQDKEITLQVPQMTSTRSSTELPGTGTPFQGAGE